MTVETRVQVTVHYVAAEEPYRVRADRSETMGQFMPQVLDAFGLASGLTSGGETVAYKLYHHKAPLDSPAETLGAIADHHEDLQLKLVQEITQG